MTLERNNVVKLSTRDWIGIGGVALTLLTILGSAYLTHGEGVVLTIHSGRPSGKA